MLRSVDWDRFSGEFASNLKAKPEQNAQITSDPPINRPLGRISNLDLRRLSKFVSDRFTAGSRCFRRELSVLPKCGWLCCFRNAAQLFRRFPQLSIEKAGESSGLLEVDHPENYPALECGRFCLPSYRCRIRLDETLPYCHRLLHTMNEGRYFVAAQRNQH